MRAQYHGIIPPVITPLLDSQTLDEEGISRLIEHMLAGGVHGLFLLGTTGEATSLTFPLREKFVKLVCTQVGDKVPVIAGITDPCADHSVEMAACYKEAGASAVVLAPPFYIPISQGEMGYYLETLIPRLPLPFFLYNMPGYTKIHLSPDTINLARQLGALGIKDSSGDLQYLYTLIDRFRQHPEFLIFSGTELFIPETILQGGHGGVAGGANMFPSLLVKLYEASIRKDLKEIARLRQVVMKIYNTIYNIGENSSKYFLGTKSALSVMGICNDYAAPPLRKFNMEKTTLIKRYVEEIKREMAEIGS